MIQVALVANDKVPAIDTINYFETGRNYVDGAGYTRQGAPELHFPPVTPIALGLMERTLGDQMHALRAWNLGWGLALVALLTLIGWWMSRDDDVTVATAWLAAAAPGLIPLAFVNGSGSEIATVTMLLASALLTCAAMDRRSPRPAILRLAGLAVAGALIGLAYLTRPEALLPGAIIAGAAVLFCLRGGTGSWSDRVWLAARGALAFGFAATLFIAPYAAYQHGNTGAWSLSTKTKDASIDAWRAVAEDDRLERDQILYAIQPDGVSLGPETRSLTAIARDNPRGWVTIAWINVRSIFHHFFGTPWRWGPVWALVPLFVLVPAVVRITQTRRSGETLLFAALAASPLVTCLVFFALPRYMMLTAAVLIPFGAWGLVRWVARLPRRARPVTWGAIAVLSLPSLLAASWTLVPGSNFPERTDQRDAGLWLAENTPLDARVMTRSFHVQGYSERPTVALPSADYVSMLDYARRMGVSYIVADEATIRFRRPELFDILMLSDDAPSGLRIVHESTERGMTIRIYQLDPPAPLSAHPPRPLGYVSD